MYALPETFCPPSRALHSTRFRLELRPKVAHGRGQARRAGLCGLLNTLIFVKLDVKSRLAGLIKKKAHFQIVNELLVSIH
jgi:hypothetical protein